MNLHNIAGPIVAAVNPWTSGQYFKSKGSTTASDGRRSPVFAPAVAVTIQMQPMAYGDLKMVEGLNLSGEQRVMYVNGDWAGVQRPDVSGGDKVTLADGTIWLIVQELESWNSTAGWSKVLVTRQNGS